MGADAKGLSPRCPTLICWHGAPPWAPMHLASGGGCPQAPGSACLGADTAVSQGLPRAGFQIPDPGGSLVEVTLQSSLQDQRRLGLWLNTPRPSLPALPLKVLASRESTFFKNPVHAHAS